MLVEFSGGLETNFSSRSLQIDAPDGVTIAWLLQHLKSLAADPNMLLQDDMLRPGILLLVNDVDWELLGEENYVLAKTDSVHLASTLHGG